MFVSREDLRSCEANVRGKEALRLSGKSDEPLTPLAGVEGAVGAANPSLELLAASNLRPWQARDYFSIKTVSACS